MPVSPLKPAAIDDTNDMTVLMTELQSCLLLADKMNLAMVGIHIEQACGWLIAHGQDAPAVAASRAVPPPSHIG